MADSEKQALPAEVLFKGSCACDRITYECTELPSDSNICHCVTCRKLSGGPYQAFADFPPSALTFFDNHELLRYEGIPREKLGGITFVNFSDVADRAFCASCYTPLVMRYHFQPQVLNLNLGSVDEESLASDKVRDALRLRHEIYMVQKAWWTEPGKGTWASHDLFSKAFGDGLHAWSERKGLAE